MLRRMRLDGLDRAALPFSEPHVQDWRQGPKPDMETEMLVNVIKVRQVRHAKSVLHAYAALLANTPVGPLEEQLDRQGVSNILQSLSLIHI